MLFVLAMSASLILLGLETWGIIVGLYIYYDCNLCLSLSLSLSIDMVVFLFYTEESTQQNLWCSWNV